MEWLQQAFKAVEPVQYIYGMIALCGGIARYLSGYAQGREPFSLPIFLASTFVSGFSGWMFAALGMSMHFPQSLVFMMAGTGGFMGDQTMKFIYEWLKSRTA